MTRTVVGQARGDAQSFGPILPRFVFHGGAGGLKLGDESGSPARQSVDDAAVE